MKERLINILDIGKKRKGIIALGFMVIIAVVIAYGASNDTEAIDNIAYAGNSYHFDSKETNDTENGIYKSEDELLTDARINGVKSAIDTDIDGDGKNETAQIMVNYDNNKWELAVRKDDAGATVEIFKGASKGFSASIAAGHIISPDTIDLLVITDYMSMPFGGCGYELYSWQDGALTQFDLANITNGTRFSINVDKKNRSAQITANGAVTAVPLSDWDWHDYELYGNEFCQDYFIEMKLQNLKGELLPKLITTEVIAAVLPDHLTYLHTTYKYVNGDWKIEKTVFSDS